MLIKSVHRNITVRNSIINPKVCIIPFLLTFIVLAGCTMKLKAFNEPEQSKYQSSPHVPDLLVYTKPMLDDSEAVRYFGVNLLRKNILAIYVSVWNNNQINNFIISEDSIKITQIKADSTVKRPEKASEDAANTAIGVHIATHAAAVGVLASGPAVTYPTWIASGVIVAVPIAEIGIPIFASQLQSNASVIKENFEVNKFKSTTLEPGEKESGFIYFNWDELKGYDEVNLCLYLKESMSMNIYQPCFNVSLGSKKGE